MKKVLIALLALGTLSFAPSAEAGNRGSYGKSKSNNESATPCPDCTVREVPDGEYTKDTMVPGVIPVKKYNRIESCTTTKVTPFEVCGEPYCATK